jgi:adenylate cyclase
MIVARFFALEPSFPEDEYSFAPDRWEAGNRLDFTCIGPAVNLAARLEKLAAQLGRAIVASAEFAHHCPGEIAALGEFALRGFAATQPAFSLQDQTA